METQKLSQTVLNFDVKKGSYPLSSKNWDIQNNNLTKFNHRSMKSRTLSLIDSFEKSLIKKKTMALGINVYSFGDMYDYNRNSEGSKPAWVSERRYEGPNMGSYVFSGVYLLDTLDKYIGEIPEDNQQKIIERFNLLDNCYFLNVRKDLLILAPINNFAYQNNISAVDPIVFAVDGSPLNKDDNRGKLYGTHLIPLTWWD